MLQGIEDNGMILTDNWRVQAKTVLFDKVTLSNTIWTASSENMHSNRCKIRRFRSSCACAKYHPVMCSQLIYSVVSNDSVSGQGRP